MRLTLVMPFAPGILRFRGPLLRMLRERGHEVFVLSPDPGEAIREGLRDLGVGWREIPLSRGDLSPRADLAAIRAMRATLRDLRPDLSIGFNPKRSCMARSRRRRRPSRGDSRWSRGSASPSRARWD